MKKTLFTFIMALVCLNQCYAQLVIKGKITDENNELVIGATVYEKGTTNGAVSDLNGKYSIRYSQANAVIVFSYVGYEKTEIKVDGKTELDVVLKKGTDLAAVEVVGSRKPNRTATETAVAIDIIDVTQVTNTTGLVDINQLLQYVTPSFNSNKQSGSDGADHVDPATLRGLGPDQTLVLINGKRRHQSALINIFGSRGRGNTGTDLNAIPASSIDRIEVLRDGASAQYGSDAIAGVINIVLKSNVDEFTGNIIAGASTANPPSEYNIKSNKDYDGETTGANGNYGFQLGEKGFINFSLDYLKKKHTNRPADPLFYDEIYRNQFGDAASENFGLYMNTVLPAGENSEFYAFGGYNYRSTDAFAFSRDAGSERNDTSIYPNGFDPEIQSVITDKSMSFGLRSARNKWHIDINNTFGANRFHYFVDHTLNSSLVDKSPTRFDAGGFQLMQNTTSLNLNRNYENILKGLNLAGGIEYRIENYQIFSGDEGSYKNYGPAIFSIDSTFDDLGNFVSLDTTLRPGGSQGFPGFQPGDEINESRTNVGAYVDAELDLTKKILVSAAARFENYSDFGSTINGKFAVRFKIIKWLSIRGSASTGFRAPSLAQLYYNSTFTDIVAGQAIDKIISRNNSPITRALGIPELKEENSLNYSAGIVFNFRSISLTADFYQVTIKDRIVLTGAFSSDDPDIGAALQALNVGAAQFFTNAVNTSTTGLDLVIAYSKVLASKHRIKISLAGNFNSMTIDKIFTNDKLKGKENTYFGLREQYFLLASAPKEKGSLAFDYSVNRFFASLHVNRFGEVKLINFFDNGDDVADEIEVDIYKAKHTLDLAIGYKLNNVSLSLGANNLLNTYPDKHNPGYTESGGIWDAVQMGFSGRFMYLRVGLKF